MLLEKTRLSTLSLNGLERNSALPSDQARLNQEGGAISPILVPCSLSIRAERSAATGSRSSVRDWTLPRDSRSTSRPTAPFQETFRKAPPDGPLPTDTRNGTPCLDQTPPLL